MCDSNLEALLEVEKILRKKINLLSTKSNKVVIIPDKRYSYPEGHPCYRCVYTFESSKPSCIIAGEPGNCSLQKFLKKQNQASEKNINSTEKNEGS